MESDKKKRSGKDIPILEHLIMNINNNNNVEVDGKLDTSNATVEKEIDDILSPDEEGIDSDKKMEYSGDELSINVSRTELEAFGDSGDMQNEELKMNHNETACDELEDEEERLASVTNSVGSLDVADIKDVLYEEKSKLHCRLCGEMFTNPKVLSCLHSFCLECLEKRKQKRNHRYLFCPICKCRTVIGNSGISSLQTNKVLERLIENQSKSQTCEEKVNLCAVCHMHEEETAATHVCKDCSDILCEGCAEKHTFSRQTAKHEVMKIDHLDKAVDVLDRIRNFDTCTNHLEEELRYFCNDCDVDACRDCVMLLHQTHQCVSQLELNKNMNDKIGEQMESVKSEVQKLQEGLEDNYKEDIDFLLEIEKNQEEVLQKIADGMIEMINRKMEKCKAELHEEIKRKKNYCYSRMEYIEGHKEKVTATCEILEFLLKEGTASDIAPLQEVINEKFQDLHKRMKGTFNRVKDLKQLPEIKPVSDNIELLNSLSFFNVLHHKPIRNENSTKDAPKKGTEKQEKKKGTQNKENKGKSKGVHGPGRSQVLQHPVSSIGRGQLLTKSSLLGPYPGPQQSHNGNQTFENSQSYKWQGFRSKEMQDYTENATKGAFLRPEGSYPHKKSNIEDISPHIKSKLVATSMKSARLTFQSSINTHMMMDKSNAKITGLTFVEKGNFAVSDMANNRLKVFSLTGTFLDMIQDVAPMSVTSCRNTLIWNAEYNKIKVYDGVSNAYKVVKQYKWDRMTHPVTSFKQEKYLVLNRENCTIEAYNLQNQIVHSVKPKDRNGRVIKNIQSIAAMSEDQVVLIDAVTNTVHVINFDGNLIGGYFEQQWQPGCAVLDHQNNIFVTDVLNNRLVLLDPRGRFKCDWTLQIEHPFCVAYNGQGSLVLSGQGSYVHHYAYNL